MKQDIANALEVLKSGGVILYPSDTGWAIGCDATNEAAVRRIFDIKKQNVSEEMVVLMENPALLDRYVTEVPEIAWDLIEITETPLTIIFTSVRNLAPGLISEKGTVGIRFTREDFSKHLVQRFRRPVTAISACVSGMPAPFYFSDINEEIIEAVDFVVKYRQDDITPAKLSSVIQLGEGGRIEIIRH
jgi:L-threonylcarbamoyladenylate synthase